MLRFPRLRSASLVGSLALALALLGAPMADADDPADMGAVQLSAAGPTTLVTVETGAAATAPRTFFLGGPDRFVIDIPNARWPGAGQGRGIGVAQRYRYANRPDGAARLVLDLAGPARLISARTDRLGRRLVFELAGLGSLARSAAPVPTPDVEPVAAPPPSMRTGRHVVVVDAGHGGRDPGAVGLSGAHEKDLNLAAALRLRDALVVRGYEVAMTRDDDRFIELADRVKFARDQGAELFISLHSDSAPGSQAHGAAVYMLSQSGEARSRRLMDAQDWRVDDVREAQGGVQNILLDLTQRETTSRSSEFARLVLAELGESGAPILHRTPRNAGFFVLLAPDVPAVLVEMGFLTQAQDEARLADPAARGRLAEALADAVDAHFARPRLMAGG